MKTDKDELSGLAGQLRKSVEGMDGAAARPPNGPNAGDSTEAVASALEKLTRSAAALTETASKAAGDLDAAGAHYGEIDQANADLFDNLG